MPELFFLGLEISPRRLRRWNFEREPLAHRLPVPFDSDKLPRVVAEQTHRADAELAENLNAQSIVALIRLESKPLVRLDGVQSFILQLVGADLVRQADSATLLIQV